MSANVPFFTVSTRRLIRGHNGLHTVRRQFFCGCGRTAGRVCRIIINIHSYILIEKAVRLLNLFNIILLFIDLNQPACDGAEPIRESRVRTLDTPTLTNGRRVSNTSIVATNPASGTGRRRFCPHRSEFVSI